MHNLLINILNFFKTLIFPPGLNSIYPGRKLLYDILLKTNSISFSIEKFMNLKLK